MGLQGIKATLAAMSENLHEPKKACLVTGAADRLGKEIALAMARCGWDVAVHYKTSAEKAKDTVELIQKTGQKAAAFQADLDDPKAVRHLFKTVSDQFEGLSCVINNASRFEFDRPESITAENIAAHMASNLTAPVLLTQELYRYLKARRESHVASNTTAGRSSGDLSSDQSGEPSGVVIHLLDQKLANPNPDFYAYTLSKAALQESVRLGAMAFAPVLRVVGISPGITLASADQTPEEFKRTHSMTPLGASSRPHEVADAVTWVAGARAVTGTVILVDGGQHLVAQPRDVMMMIR